MTTWIIGGIIAYLLFFRNGFAALAPAPPAPTPANISTAPGETTITIPGVGTYVNVGGGQSVAITLDGNLIQSLFGGAG